VPAWAKKSTKPTYTQNEVADTTTYVRMTPAERTKLNGIAAGANNYSLSPATTSALGGIQLGYSKNNKNYPVVLDGNNKAYVNVPWVNTTYNAYNGANGGIVLTTGTGNTASGTNAVASGFGSEATGDNSTAMGYKCIVSVAGGHAEGNTCKVTGAGGHAEGSNCQVFN
jgi:hypothetical protein